MDENAISEIRHAISRVTGHLMDEVFRQASADSMSHAAKWASLVPHQPGSVIASPHQSDIYLTSDYETSCDSMDFSKPITEQEKEEFWEQARDIL